MLVGPERDVVEVVEEAVAVGAEDRHVPGGSDEGGLEGGVAGLAEAGGEADGAAGAGGGKLADDLDGEPAVDADEGGVGGGGQGAVARDAADCGRVGWIGQTAPE